MGEKIPASELMEKLSFKGTHASKRMSDDTVAAADEYCIGYMDFLTRVKTEREAVKYAVERAKENGFTEFVPGRKYMPGDKVYVNNRNKAVILCVIGTKSLADGVRISAAHIDSPRLDLKQHPLYEKDEAALLKTHYYGGIRKYQWPTIPLAIHGVIIKSSGETIDITIGEDDSDPKFVITDLLPHLAAEQNKRPLAEGIKGEELNVLAGSRPYDSSDDTDSTVKLNILNILYEKYGVTEDDLMSAELEIVPAAKPCDIGFDRSMIGAYGHDDRVCAYPSLSAILETTAPEYTCMTVLTDKEEIGSDGNTGLNSSYMKYFIYDLAESNGLHGHSVLSKSQCLSADVNSAYDPTFSNAFEKNNSSLINHGVVVTKYTGSRGKSGASDASAEFVAFTRSFLDKNDVIWQTGELGKVDAGGGGTVSKYVASLDVDVIDIGVPVLSMHAPFEVVAKTDVYMTYRAVLEFFRA